MSADVDPRLVLELLTGALHVRLFVKSERVDDVIISRIVDVIVAGVTPATRRRKTKRR
jgi:hypothetical protein